MNPRLAQVIYNLFADSFPDIEDLVRHDDEVFLYFPDGSEVHVRCVEAPPQ